MAEEPRMARNLSVLASDQARVAKAPEMSLRGDVTPRGDRVYVGEAQEIMATFGTGEADTPKAFSVIMPYVPSKVMPRGLIRVTDGGVARLCAINEVHDATHVWTQTQIWLMSSQDDVAQEMLVV